MQTRVLFIADKLAADARSSRVPHAGGAELTDLAAIEACPHEIDVRRVRDVAPGEVDRYDVIVVANADTASPALLQAIARTRRHTLFEHDLRSCAWRGDFPEARGLAHRVAHRCFCREERWRDLVESACGVIYLTGLQRVAYHDNPNRPRPAREVVLGSSLFSHALLDAMRELSRSVTDRSHTAISWSPCVIKGHAVSLEHCRRAGLAVRELRCLPYPEVLRLLSRSERLVYLPFGLEPAGRMPVEARLLGCEVVVNSHVGIAREPLWELSPAEAIASLREAPVRFWRLVAGLSDGSVAPAPALPEVPTRAAYLSAARDLASVRRHPAVSHRWLSQAVAERALTTRTAAPWPWP